MASSLSQTSTTLFTFVILPSTQSNTFIISLCRLILPSQGTQGHLPHGKLSRDRDLGQGRDLGRGLGLDKGQDRVLEVVAGQGHQFVEGWPFSILSRSPIHGRSEPTNPGDTLYVTGLSSRVTERDLEEHFSKEGKVSSCFLVVEPRTRISRGFAFVTMESAEDAERCIKYLNQSVLEGRYITVERSRRKRARTPTPGHYLGLKNTREYGYRGDRGGDRGRYRDGPDRDNYSRRRSPRRSPYRGGQDYSPQRSPYGGRSRRERSRSLPYSPHGSPDRKYARGSR
ncbi:Serine/arginine-rich splicing factor SR45a [Glycine soja]